MHVSKFSKPGIRVSQPGSYPILGINTQATNREFVCMPVSFPNEPNPRRNGAPVINALPDIQDFG